VIIGLSGYAQSGKDTVAKILVDHYGFRRVAFADKIRDMLYELNPIVSCEEHDSSLGYIRVKDLVDDYGWDSAKKEVEIREYLQRLGVSARNHIGSDVWVKSAINKVWGPNDHVVITDVRFKNEAQAIKEIYALNQLWRVIRPGVGAVNNHISERDLDDYEFDFDIYNEGTLISLHEDIDILMEDMRV
jgi:hypothetical protein